MYQPTPSNKIITTTDPTPFSLLTSNIQCIQYIQFQTTLLTIHQQQPTGPIPFFPSNFNNSSSSPKCHQQLYAAALLPRIFWDFGEISCQTQLLPVGLEKEQEI